MGRFDWSAWSVGVRASFVLFVVGSVIFGLVLPLAFGQLWAVPLAALCLGIYIAVYVRYAHQRGLHQTEDYRQRLKQRLVGTAIGILILAAIWIAKAALS